VNVLLVPAHPGFPGQIPQSRKTVVVVVVVVRANREMKQRQMIALKRIVLISVTLANTVEFY